MISLVDFLRNVARADNPRRYLATWGIFDLASALPTVGAFRFLRLVRLIRVLRAFWSIRTLVQVASKDASAAFFVGFLTITMTLFIGICIAVLHVEARAPGANIVHASDILWWAVATTSTVGYGDHCPGTPAGRLLASLLMFVGIGLFATASGAIAGAVTQAFGANDSRSAVAHELESLRDAVGRIEQSLNEQADTRRDPH